MKTDLAQFLAARKEMVDSLHALLDVQTPATERDSLITRAQTNYGTLTRLVADQDEFRDEDVVLRIVLSPPRQSPPKLQVCPHCHRPIP